MRFNHKINIKHGDSDGGADAVTLRSGRCGSLFYRILLVLIFVLAIFFRAKIYVANPSMWHDECALAWNVINKPFWGFFGSLGFSQVAPPLFMVFAKISTKIFGVSDLSLRLVPFILSILSLTMFYFVAKGCFKNKFSVALALFLFSINQALINYSTEFKHYGTDVFCTLLCLYFFSKLGIEKISIKKLILSSIGLAVLMWLSFVSFFTIAAGLSLTLFVKFKENWKKKLILAIPVFLSALVYLKFYLANLSLKTGMESYWNENFVRGDFLNIFTLTDANIRYFYFPSNYVLFAFIFLFAGIFIGFRQKNKFIQISFLTFSGVILASMLHLYPFSGRLVLFLLPLTLLTMIIPLDCVTMKRKFLSSLTIIMVVGFFLIQLRFVPFMFKNTNFSRGEYPREMISYMSQKIESSDIIFLNQPSEVEYSYYNEYSELKNRVIKENLQNPTQKEYWAFLNSLPKDNYYWFYLPYDSSHRPVLSFISPWAFKNARIIEQHKLSPQSVLLYLYIGK